ncbi:MAG: hypothetical protein IPJ23_14165 [Ignavibacteriales bacterium]|nr:hypothetical protein [Ignavibacteriales bacterium]
MLSNQIKILVLCFLLSSIIFPQSGNRFLSEKPGKWSVKSSLNNLPKKDKANFENNLISVAERFHKNLKMLAEPKGFDLPITFNSIWDEEYKTRDYNFAYRCEMDFAFQLFIVENEKETKWTIEPPHYEIDINNTEAGHGNNFDIGELKGLFAVFPLVKEIAPGVRLYGDGNLIVFNSSRPEFWIPLTVREVVNAKLTAYAKEDKSLYDFIKPLVDKMTEEELNAPAYYGSDDAILNVNGKQDGLQIMRFNKDYWDQSLPKTSIQFIRMWYRPANEFNMEEHIKNNGHPHYGQLLMNELPLKELGSLIQKK